MSRISPKLIDVERNRVGSEGGTFNHYNSNELYSDYRMIDGDTTYGGGKGLSKYKYKPTFLNKGRFPTQLFTNIKNNRYKYVKHIT